MKSMKKHDFFRNEIFKFFSSLQCATATFYLIFILKENNYFIFFYFSFNTASLTLTYIYKLFRVVKCTGSNKLIRNKMIELQVV